MTTQARELAKLVNNSGDVNLVDDITLGSDGALLNFGADSDVVITHVADTGLLLNSTRQLQFGDSGTHIRQSADGVLQLTSDTEVEINATTIDINGNVDISGNLVLGGNITIGDADSDDISFGGELTSHIVPNADDTYDLGSSTKQWRNLYVDGTANLDVVDIDGAVDFASTTAHAGNATFADNAKALFGAGSDLEIYHNGSHSNIRDVGSGNLYIDGSASINFRSGDAGETYAIFNDDGAVSLYHNNAVKLATASGGVDITGTLTATTLAGTLSTAAQTNITSVGTLTSLNTSGDITVTSTDTGSSASPIINLVRDSSSPADADYIGQIKFKGEDDGGASTTYSKITGKIGDASNGSEDGIIEFAAQKAGSSTILARLSSTKLALLNSTELEAPVVDGENFKINGAQGSDGQLMTSTGSGVAWEDAPASGPSKGLAIAFSMIF